MVNVVADAPLFGQGEIVAKPRPEPSNTSTMATAAAATAPAKIEAQQTAETGDSTGAVASIG
jgi:hypothetical protein